MREELIEYRRGILKSGIYTRELGQFLRYVLGLSFADRTGALFLEPSKHTLRPQWSAVEPQSRTETAEPNLSITSAQDSDAPYECSIASPIEIHAVSQPIPIKDNRMDQ